MAMASSSLSQESLDIDDYDTAIRKSRTRTLRSRVGVHKNESIETTDDKDLEEELDCFTDKKENGEFTMYSSLGPGAAVGEHESPTRMASRQKDKRGRLNHLHKGKTAKDKRKLREKRRSTGVVHLASTEVRSTGDSLDDDGRDSETQTRRNTSYNEVIDNDNPQTPEEDRKSFTARNVINKSPSDLDADLEDNQDYDSTVSQSETNLTMIGQSVHNTRPPTDFHMEAAPELIRPCAHPAVDSPDSPKSLTQPHHNLDPHHHHKHHTHRQPDGRHVTVHFREGGDTTSNSDTTVRGHPSHHEGGALRRTTAHDGMEARLLAKSVELEKQLEKEREEKRHLQELLDERECRIAQLERELALLNKDLEECDGENEKLQQEKDALLRAMSALNTK